MIRNRLKSNWLYAALFLTLFLLCFLFPYTGDDWAWGIDLGIERMNSWFKDYNGRYLGNMIVIVLTRSNILKTLAMSVCIGGIVVMINEMTHRQPCSFGMILICLVFMPVSVLGQSIVWTAGFSNYTTSIFLTLIYIYYMRNLYTEEPKNCYYISLPLAILGVCNALIVEHLTIYNVLLGCYAIAFTFMKYRKICIQHVSYLVGTVAGTIIMFSNGAYHTIAQGDDTYRSIAADSGIFERISTNLNIITAQGFLNNLVLLSLLMVACLILWFEHKDKLSGMKKILGCLSVFIIVSYTALSFMDMLNTYSEKAWILTFLEISATVFYALSLIVFVLILPLDKMAKHRLLFILFSAGLMMAPLLIVTPIGPRCFLAPYVMLIYFLVALTGQFNDVHKHQFARLRNSFLIFAAIGTLYLFYIYGTITKNNQERIAKAIEDSKQKDTIEVQQLPYKNYVWCSEVGANQEPWSLRFKLFYGIDKEVSIKMVPHR